MPAAFLLALAACSPGTDEADVPPAEDPTTANLSAPSSTSLLTTTSAALEPPTTSRAPDTAGPGTSRPAATDAPTSTAPPTTVAGEAPWFVVSVTGWIPDGFANPLAELPGVEVVSVVRIGNAAVVETRDGSGNVVDRTRRGFVIPVELQAIDPTGHAEFVPPEIAVRLDSLLPDQVILGESSARLRRLGPGATVVLEDGTELEVAAVVDDRWVGFAEMVTTVPDPDRLGTERDRYAVVRFDGTREELEAAMMTLTDLAVRVQDEAGAAVFRHADAVQPQVVIKERFGEFSFRGGRGQRVEIDPAWVEANIVTARLPRIGSVTCHREFIEMLRGVMEQLVAEGNGRLIGPGSDNGCWNPRFIAGRRDLSRHSWGIAADINWGNDHDGPRSPVAPALLEAMEEAGITSGHAWTNPDAGHFEWYEDKA